MVENIVIWFRDIAPVSSFAFWCTNDIELKG
jgi:hypothetical protein